MKLKTSDIIIGDKTILEHAEHICRKLGVGAEDGNMAQLSGIDAYIEEYIRQPMLEDQENLADALATALECSAVMASEVDYKQTAKTIRRMISAKQTLTEYRKRNP